MKRKICLERIHLLFDLLKTLATNGVVVLCLSSLYYSLNASATYQPKPYERAVGVAGDLVSVGSDTLAGVMSLWGASFQDYYPNVNTQVQASGSSTAPPALIQGTAQIGLMSRRMHQTELNAFQRAYGYPPTAVRIAIDAIGVFVQKDNPIQGLNFEQLDAIFSATLRCGASQTINKWSQLGIYTYWGQRTIQLFGRNAVSGTYVHFKAHALCDGDFSDRVNELPGSASVVQSVASSLNAIGYSGMGYTVSGVKLLPIAPRGSHQYVMPTRAHIVSGTYPLSRYLYMYINLPPSQSQSPVLTEFIRYIFSQEGQAQITQSGYVPLSNEMIERELKHLSLNIQ